MHLKKLINNESGFIHTLEAAIGIFLIIGTVMFISNNMPHTAKNTEEHSKIQLMNIGRDTLDLILITPSYETCPYCLAGIVDRQYTLVADKTSVMPGELVNFTVYYLNGTLVGIPLTLKQTILGTSGETNMTTIIGGTSYLWLPPGNESEFNIRAIDQYGGMSNYITIDVGYYHLDTDTDGIYKFGDQNVSGVVYNSSGFGIPNLIIQIFGYSGNTLGWLDNAPNRTIYGRIIENFDNPNNWSTDGYATSNFSEKIQGTASLSINSTSENFWIKKALTQRLDKYDMLSFYFYANTGNEIITIDFLNNTFPFPVFTHTVKSSITKWNKINTLLNVSNVADIDTIKISVSNITTNNYLFDNMTVGDGKFSFLWTELKNSGSTGTYYIGATDGIHNSNRHRIIYSDKPAGGTLCCDSVIYETMSVDLFMMDNSTFTGALGINSFFINNEKYDSYNTSKISIVPYPGNNRVKFTANISGDYYVHIGNVNVNNDNANGAKTNSILIRVLPLINTGPTSDVCVDKEELKIYMDKYIPPNINYNLYLIGSTGNRFMNCTKFEGGELINGYPTDEAVTVSKPIHIKYRDVDNILEFRILLWYK